MSRGTSAILGLILLVGCVSPLHRSTLSALRFVRPIIQDDESVVFDERLLGTWEERSGKDSLIFSRRRDDNAYNLTYRHIDGARRIDARLVAKLVNLDGVLFLGIFPEFSETGNVWDFLHLIPSMTFPRVDFTDDTLLVTNLEESWVRSEIEAGRLDVAHEMLNDGSLLLTASREENGKLMSQLLDVREAWGEPVTLVKVGDAGG